MASPLRLQRTTSTPTYVLSFAHVCASKTRGGSLGLRTYSMTPGATRLSKLVGCALSLSVFLLWQLPQRLQSLHTARKGLPHRTTWSSLQVPVSPHSARLPSCAARVFCLSAAPGTSRFALSRKLPAALRGERAAKRPSRTSRSACPELLQLSVEEVCADFDAMLRHDWRRLGISAEEVREFCVWRNAPSVC